VSHVDIDTLSPRRIKAMLQEAESGDISAQSALFEKMEEKDGELDAHLRTRKRGVSRLNHHIQPADDSDRATEAAELCREMVGEIPDMPQAIFDLLDAVGKGFSVLEIDWNTESGRWTPAQLIWRPQRWFTVDEDGRTLLLRDATGSGTRLNPLNFIIHRVQARSGFCSRTGLLRSCVRAFVVRHISWKDWMSFAEVYGMPPRIGRLREGVPWDSEEARELWKAVRALGMDAAAVVRQGNEIELVDTR
jgi:phage gp29-like protein